jgi:phage terminase large subunit GpA-like protein
MTSLPFLPEQIEQWPVARLQPYARNARTHSSDQIAKIAASLVEYGWTAPVMVTDEGEIVAGHGRLLAAQQLGLGWLSWERIARDWEACQSSDEAKRSFINTVLGETGAETGEAPDWQRLYERREDYPIR